MSKNIKFYDKITNRELEVLLSRKYGDYDFIINRADKTQTNVILTQKQVEELLDFLLDQVISPEQIDYHSQ